MWTILGLFLSLSAFALDTGEQMRNVKIQKVLPDNILLFNKGLEDGISRNDHVMVVQENEGYASRGLCLKSEAEQSYWKVYRIPHAEAFSKDFSYVLTGIADKEIPEEIAELKDTQFAFENVKDAPVEIKSDLPSAMSQAFKEMNKKVAE